MPGGYTAQNPNWAGVSGEGAFPDMLKALFYKGGFGEEAFGALQGLLDPNAWKEQFQIGRDILGMDRAQSGQQLSQEMAGRGMYRQGPMSAGLKGLEGDYQAALTKLLGATQQQGLARQQQALQMLMQMVMQGGELDQRADENKYSWLGGLGDLFSGLMPFLPTGGGGGGGGKTAKV